VTGDGRADAIRFANSRVYVYPANGAGTTFDPPQAWTSGPYYGQLGSTVTAYEGGNTDPIVMLWMVFDRNSIFAMG
jgi:hypothetical protein